MLAPRFIIFVETIGGDIIRAFTWCRDEASGVARARRDTQDFGVTTVRIWAEPIAMEV